MHQVLDTVRSIVAGAVLDARMRPAFCVLLPDSRGKLSRPRHLVRDTIGYSAETSLTEKLVPGHALLYHRQTRNIETLNYKKQKQRKTGPAKRSIRRSV